MTSTSRSTRDRTWSSSTTRMRVGMASHRHGGERNAHGGADAEGASNRQRAAVIRHDPMGDREAEPGAAETGIGAAEELLREMRDLALRDARPAIDDLDDDEIRTFARR